MKILREIDKKNEFFLSDKSNEFFLPANLFRSHKKIISYKHGERVITKKRSLWKEESLLYIQDTQYLYGNKFKGHYTSYYITDTNILCHLYVLFVFPNIYTTVVSTTLIAVVSCYRIRFAFVVKN